MSKRASRWPGFDRFYQFVRRGLQVGVSWICPKKMRSWCISFHSKVQNPSVPQSPQDLCAISRLKQLLGWNGSVRTCGGCWRWSGSQSLRCDLYTQMIRIQAYACEIWQTGEKSLSSFMAARIDANRQPLWVTCSPLLMEFGPDCHVQWWRSITLLLKLLRFFFPFDFPVRLLRTFTSPLQRCVHCCLVAPQRQLWGGWRRCRLLTQFLSDQMRSFAKTEN